MSSHSKKYDKITTNQKVAGSNPAGATIAIQTPQAVAVFFIFRSANIKMTEHLRKPIYLEQFQHTPKNGVSKFRKSY